MKYLKNRSKPILYFKKGEFSMEEKKEVFEEGVQIASVVENIDDINEEALAHLDTMGKGDEE